MSATDDCRSFAGAGPAGVDSERIEIDSRHRARRRPFKPGLGQRARFGGAENFVATTSEAESRIAEIARPSGVWCKPRKGRRRGQIVGAAFAKRNSRNAGAGRQVEKSARR